MSQIATGVFKKVYYEKQSAIGVPADGSTGETARRVTSTIDLKKAQYRSNEINASMQRRDSRHGVRSVAGSISGELSIGGYQTFFEAVTRQAAQSGGTTASATVTSAVTVAPAGTFTRSSGSWITDGFKVGDIVRATGFSTATANNSNNLIVTALTATVMTVYPLNGLAIAAEAGATVAVAHPGKKAYIPQTGHTRDYFTIEHWHSDIAQSEVFTDCVIGAANVKMPATGMVTVEFPVMGLDLGDTGTSAYFTAPSAAPTGGITASVNGAIFVGGVKYGTVTSMDLNINGNNSAPGGVVGSNKDPDIFPGMIDVSGQMAILFDSVTLRDQFVNEDQVTVVVALSASNANLAGAICFVMSNVKLGGADKDDGEKGLTMTVPFIASENVLGGAGTAHLQTTISIQDTAFA